MNWGRAGAVFEVTHIGTANSASFKLVLDSPACLQEWRRKQEEVSSKVLGYLPGAFDTDLLLSPLLEVSGHACLRRAHVLEHVASLFFCKKKTLCFIVCNSKKFGKKAGKNPWCLLTGNLFCKQWWSTSWDTGQLSERSESHLLTNMQTSAMHIKHGKVSLWVENRGSMHIHI